MNRPDSGSTLPQYPDLSRLIALAPIFAKFLSVRRRNFQRGHRIALPRKIKAVRARARANIKNSITGAQIAFNITNGR